MINSPVLEALTKYTNFARMVERYIYNERNDSNTFSITTQPTTNLPSETHQPTIGFQLLDFLSVMIKVRYYDFMN